MYLRINFDTNIKIISQITQFVNHFIKSEINPKGNNSLEPSISGDTRGSTRFGGEGDLRLWRRASVHITVLCSLWHARLPSCNRPQTDRFRKSPPSKISQDSFVRGAAGHTNAPPHLVWRRERDLNPRKLSLQRFSRPPRSTAPPTFLFAYKILTQK